MQQLSAGGNSQQGSRRQRKREKKRLVGQHFHDQYEAHQWHLASDASYLLQTVRDVTVAVLVRSLEVGGCKRRESAAARAIKTKKLKQG